MSFLYISKERELLGKGGKFFFSFCYVEKLFYVMALVGNFH